MFGAFVGIGISTLVAFVVLSVTTMNPFVALLSCFTILLVVSSILGFMWLFGWELGTIESVSATVLVGLSIDYVVHLAHSYMEATATSRKERVRMALTEMGCTVLGGGVTSMGASFHVVYVLVSAFLQVWSFYVLDCVALPVLCALLLHAAAVTHWA